MGCFKNQTYPKHRLEWIIVDDGTDKIKDLIDEETFHKSNISQLRKNDLRKKRNYMHEKSSGSYCIYG